MSRVRLSVFFASMLVAGSVVAAPEYARLSYTADPQTSMAVTWNTTTASAAEVQYGTASGAYTKTVTAKSTQANAGLGYIHEAELTGLTPSTKYFYIAGSTAGGFTTEASFTTGPAADPSCGSAKFAFLADNRPDPIFGGGDNWPQIMAQAAAHKPAFMLNGGDLVIDGDKIDQWLKLLGWTSPVAKTIPFMPSMGNHDTGPGSGDGANYNQIFALPRSTGAKGSNTEDYYFFTYANAIFVSLSTDSFKGGTIPFADQAAWLDTVLTQNPKKWKFVYFHKPIYTTKSSFSISHPPNEANQNAALVPIFDKHHVDAVLTSHNHWYERFEPSACATKGTPGSANACSVGATNFAGGTVYYVSGGAGAFTIPKLFCGSTAGRAKCSDEHHYLLVDIQNDTMKIETWGANPQPNTVIDSITIKKGTEVCGGPPDGGVGGTGGSGGSTGGSGGATTGGGGSSGGSAGSGGSAAGAGGSAGTAGGAPDASAGGSPGGGGSSSGGGSSGESEDDGGCGCRAAGSTSAPAAWVVLSGLAFAAARRRRRRA
ncbi:MAG: metallophosphoesterase family protein [Myxococcales bacterium]|nr:metallophosphoesterase family protein [Myxococcales bacterium]